MTTNNSIRPQRHIAVALAIVLGIAATGCSKHVDATNDPVPTTHGYSYDHDSRINGAP